MKLVFLHGLGQNQDSWDAVIKNLDSNTQCVSLDLFASVHENSQLSFSLLNEQLTKRLSLIKEPYILCGLSLGGILALTQATMKNNFLQGIIVSGAQFESPNKILIDLQNLMFQFMPNKNFIELGITKRQTIALCKSLKALNLRKNMFYINIPTLVICGAEDKANLNASEELATLIPNAELHIIPGQHILNEEQPLAFAKLINMYHKKYFSSQENRGDIEKAVIVNK
ncbi:alpha/beta fold hydrolase [Weissella sagaensis]|uniref:alpha/beta fold hydrolase n=1 Tax=Weissella sagaensis TaxID=2559928 RepID=UPI00214B169B|nr:alpha/beta fold hydrolase [Weissella sagaensis]